MKNFAGLWQRVGAFVLDYVIILFYLAAITLFFVLSSSRFGLDDLLFTDRVRAQITSFLLITLPVTLYFAIGECSEKQATWGKGQMKLKVTDYKGERISFWRSLARTALKFVPWELSHTLIWELSFSPQADSFLINLGFGLVYVLAGLNIFSLLRTRNQQTIYDLIAKTVVIQQTP